MSLLPKLREALSPNLNDRSSDAVGEVRRALVPRNDCAELVGVDPQMHLYSVSGSGDPPQVFEREFEPLHDIGVSAPGLP